MSIRLVVALCSLLLSSNSGWSHAVPLSDLVADPEATLTGGSLIYSHFTYEPVGALPLLPVGVIAVSADAPSANLSRIRFGSFTVDADSAAFARISYRVTPTTAWVSDAHLATPSATVGPVASARAYEDAGFLISKTMNGIGSTFVQGVGPTLALPRSHGLMGLDGATPQFPTNLSSLDVTATLQLFGGSSFFAGPGGDAFVGLPYFEQIYTVVPEPGTLILLVLGWGMGLAARLGVDARREDTASGCHEAIDRETSQDGWT